MAATGSSWASPRSARSPTWPASTSGPDRLTAAAIDSDSRSSCSELTGRLLAARSSPPRSFWLSNRSRRPSRLRTVTFLSARSYVVKRLPQPPHSRRRRTASPASRVSTTLVESDSQNGQCTRAILLPVVPESCPRHYILCALCEVNVIQHRLAARPAAVGRRVEAIPDEVRVAKELRKTFGRCVKIEPRRVLGPVVSERVDHLGRRHHEGPRPGAHPLDLRPETEVELAGEDEERVEVLLVDVRAGALLARHVARPGQAELGEVGEDADRPLRLVGDDLALLGERQHDGVARRAALVLRRVEDVVGLLGRGLAEEVVGEVARGRVEVEEGALLGRLVLVAMDHPLRDHQHCAGAARGSLVAELERVLALEHDEAVGVLAV